ncbi:FtsX-like permease family protein [Streptomyces sp. NBC_01500]|uniref:ABC transporter permease n=1 Tax=Streptomyces sp. NBC_01500 TaxID=2903886 RepID=UPI00224D54B4|nr:FtsX-like permease family protein [Streptomyces sp. NBC_01500]MCX4549694.1 FtsX-like permease family protein [Streptomyces sp. NBC_01500]
MSALSGWRAAIRIARRDALRAKGRSALVVAMIALPVLGVTAADITYHSASLTTAEKLSAELGSADALFRDPSMGGGPIEQMPEMDPYQPVDQDSTGTKPDSAVDLAAVLPPGAKSITQQYMNATVTTKYGIKNTALTELKTADPLVRGMIELVNGRFPKTDSEMVANEAFLKSSGLHIGSQTTVRGAGRTFTITGSVELPADLKHDYLYVNPGALIAPWKQAAAKDRTMEEPQAGTVDLLVKTAGSTGVSWKDVLAANKKGVLVESRRVFLDPPPLSEVPMASHGSYQAPGKGMKVTAALATVVAMAMLEIVLLAGPAFAVGARRSRRQLGLVGTCGGNRRHIRAVVLSGGLVLGAAGAVAGTIVGLGLTYLLRPLIESWAGQRFGTIELHSGELLGIAVIGLVTGVLAALAPAIVAGRQPILESLTGRRGVRRSSRVMPVLGLIAIGVGLCLAVLGGLSGRATSVSIGSVIAELGVLACIPVIVGSLGKLGRFFPLSPRLALRDAARNRGRTAPAVAAVMAAVAGTIAISTYTASTQAEQDYGRHSSVPKGVVSINADTYGERADPARALALARKVAERDLPVKGVPATINRVWAGSDCNHFPDADTSNCGALDLVRPAANNCPLLAAGGKTLAAKLSADEHKKLVNSPKCKDAEYPDTMFGNDGEIVVGDAAVLRVYAGMKDPAAEKALAAGVPVLLNNAYADADGKATVKALHSYIAEDKQNRKLHPGKARSTVTRLAVYKAADRYAATPGIRMVMPQATADRLGLHYGPTLNVYATTQTPTDAQVQHFNDGVSQAGNGVSLQQNDTSSGTTDITMLILALFSGVVTLGAAAITTGLAKADAEADLTTLSAIGAPPRVRRTLSGFQCAVVAGTGVLLGTAAGVVPAIAVRLTDMHRALANMRLHPMDSAYTPIVLPWQTIGILALAVPVLAGLLAGVFVRSRLVLARRAG